MGLADVSSLILSGQMLQGLSTGLDNLVRTVVPFSTDGNQSSIFNSGLYGFGEQKEPFIPQVERTRNF